MRTIFKISIIFISLNFVCAKVSAQDLIVKTNGDTVRAKILEVGTNAVSFKKTAFSDGPTFVESKADIVMIKYANGQIEKFANAINTSTTSANSMTNSAMSNTAATTSSAIATSTAGSGNQSDKVKIERNGKKYTINGQKASQKQVNEQLGKSKNPAIIVPLKAAKLTSGAQRIVKIANIPASIGGGFTTLFTVVNMYNDVQRGRATTSSYVNAAISLAGTLTLPITNKILKKKSGKMYDTLIDMYNVTN